MPFVVRQKTAIPGLLAKGFRQTLPQTCTPKFEKRSSEPVTDPESTPIVSNADQDGLAINQITEKELASQVKGVGLVKARRILKSKPFKTIEDLYEVEPSVDWSSIPVNYALETDNPE